MTPSPFAGRSEGAILRGLLTATVGGAVGLALTGRWRAAALVAGAAHAAFCATAAIPNHSLVGPVVKRFQSARREVWLTIDDGPDPASTPAVLALLRQHGARATFFVIGERAARHPDLLREIVAAGHTLGNHTFHHPSASFWTRGPAGIADEIDRTQDAIVDTGLPAPRWFRPPVGMANVLVEPALRRRGLVRIGWSARGFDTRPQTPAKVVTGIMRACSPGAIILAHEANPTAGVRCLRPLLERLAAESYRCVLPAEAALLPGGTKS